MVSKIDYFIGGLVGFFAGMFAIPTLISVGIYSLAMFFPALAYPLFFMSLGLPYPWWLLVLPWEFGILFAIGIWVGNKLVKVSSVFPQFSRFVAVGILNTTIDFGVLNLISAAAGVTAGVVIGGVNVPGFVVAVTNSYFWNKLWVFKNKDKLFSDFLQFVAVTAVGLLLNSIIVITLTSAIAPPLGLGATRWLNVSKACATVFTLIWNFLGYKFIVFRAKKAEVAPETDV